MRASHYVKDGSFRERVEDLVPLFGLDPSTTRRGPGEFSIAATGVRGSAVYEINQYLFEGSRQ